MQTLNRAIGLTDDSGAAMEHQRVDFGKWAHTGYLVFTAARRLTEAAKTTNIRNFPRMSSAYSTRATRTIIASLRTLKCAHWNQRRLELCKRRVLRPRRTSRSRSSTLLS